MADPEDGRMTGAHVDEGEVHAWLDGQLSAAESARLESHIAACEPCAARVAEARGFVAASSRILSGLDGVPSRVVPRAWSRARVWQLRAAAAVVVVALGAAAVLSDAGGRLGQLRREPVAHHPDTAVPPAMGPALATAPLATPAAPPPAAAVSSPTVAKPHAAAQAAERQQAVRSASPRPPNAPAPAIADAGGAAGGTVMAGQQNSSTSAAFAPSRMAAKAMQSAPLSAPPAVPQAAGQGVGGGVVRTWASDSSARADVAGLAWRPGDPARLSRVRRESRDPGDR